MTRRYTIHFTDGKRATVIVMDGELTDEKVQYDLRSQFKAGYVERIIEEKKK